MCLNRRGTGSPCRARCFTGVFSYSLASSPSPVCRWEPRHREVAYVGPGRAVSGRDRTGTQAGCSSPHGSSQVWPPPAASAPPGTAPGSLLETPVITPPQTHRVGAGPAGSHADAHAGWRAAGYELGGLGGTCPGPFFTSLLPSSEGWATAPTSGLERVWEPLKTPGRVREEKGAMREALEPPAPTALGSRRNPGARGCGKGWELCKRRGKPQAWLQL